MKICLISFDHWEYDKYIVDNLKEKGITATHINTGKFRYHYPTPFHRIYNFLNKVFFKRNIKKIKQREYILDEFKKLGKQDKILVVNPELIPADIHKKIKTFTAEYIAYLYDSSKRYPIEHLLDGIFDRIFSFDKDDVNKYGFLHITNYIYLEKKPLKTNFRYKLFMILSVDDRLPTLNKIAYKLDDLGVNYKIILVSKHKPDNLNPNITWQKNILKLPELEQYMAESEIFMDIIRDNQDGLSFRVFESLAWQRKLISTNKTIPEYSFYTPENILIIDKDDIDISPDFLTIAYKPLPEAVYNQYTLDNWVNTVFELKLNERQP